MNRIAMLSLLAAVAVAPVKAQDNADNAAAALAELLSRAQLHDAQWYAPVGTNELLVHTTRSLDVEALHAMAADRSYGYHPGSRAVKERVCEVVLGEPSACARRASGCSLRLLAEHLGIRIVRVVTLLGEVACDVVVDELDSPIDFAIDAIMLDGAPATLHEPRRVVVPGQVYSLGIEYSGEAQGEVTARWDEPHGSIEETGHLAWTYTAPTDLVDGGQDVLRVTAIRGRYQASGAAIVCIESCSAD